MKKDEEYQEMHYLKYYSNGDLDKLNNHHCICCKQLKNDTDIFVFTDNSIFTAEPSTSPAPYTTVTGTGTRSTGGAITGTSTSSSRLFSGQNMSFRPAKKDSIYLCAECVFKLSKQISPEVLGKMVVDKL